MMPDKIYVEIRHPFGNEFTEMLGFESRGNSDDVEYIRTDYLIRWAIEKKAELLGDEPTDVAAGINMGMDMLIYKLKKQ